MHYTERQIAITNLHDALERRGGWNIVGYWPRDNDPYADYPKPASWDGLATKDGATLVVDRGDLTKSGWERAVNERTDGETCKDCNGSREDASGWTYEQATADPKRFNEETSPPGTRAVFADVVSPLHFHGDGTMKCRTCQGKGNLPGEPRRIVQEVYPQHAHTTPSGYMWHLERDGKIIAKGKGFDRAADGWTDEIVLTIENALTNKPEAKAETADKPLVRRNEARNGIEIVFPKKPDDGTRAKMKEAGFRWHRVKKYWYATYSDERLQVAHEVVGA